MQVAQPLASKLLDSPIYKRRVLLHEQGDRGGDKRKNTHIWNTRRKKTQQAKREHRRRKPNRGCGKFLAKTKSSKQERSETLI